MSCCAMPCRAVQRQALEVHYLLAEGSADDVIWPLVNHKLRVVGRAVAGATGEAAVTGLVAGRFNALVHCSRCHMLL